MMIKPIIPLFLTLVPNLIMAQNAKSIIDLVSLKQETVKNISYSINRIDTIGEYVRIMKGKAMLEKLENDTVYGFKFWSGKNNDPIEKMYDGRIGYSINVEKKSYETYMSVAGLANLLNGGGGHLVMPDFMKLKIEGSSDVSLTEEAETYNLLFRYPDNMEFEIMNKFKLVKVDKKTMLPIAIREHQESLGRRQDLYYEINELKINDPGFSYDFSRPSFLQFYEHIFPIRKESQIQNLIGKSLPYFNLKTFNNKSVKSTDLKGHVVLLDFWEIWCAPCLQSMPKVVDLWKTYRHMGFQAYGIINDKGNFESSKLWVTKKEIRLPMLVGNEQLRQNFLINSIPLYVLIDREGKICFITEGYSDDLHKEIIKALNNKKKQP